ncbi:hypothetical protein CBM2598_U30052 [Cupriavidus taiwanensis]|nr:hypothetical protein CBM2598_U30052 [Cupriavidus taiwanensis]
MVYQKCAAVVEADLPLVEQRVECGHQQQSVVRVEPHVVIGARVGPRHNVAGPQRLAYCHACHCARAGPVPLEVLAELALAETRIDQTLACGRADFPPSYLCQVVCEGPRAPPVCVWNLSSWRMINPPAIPAWPRPFALW